MVTFSGDYYEKLFQITRTIRVSDASGSSLSFREGIERSVGLILDRTGSGSKVMFIGNGGSAAVSSHMSTDFAKNGRMKAMAFNDPALLTCMGNDYGYAHVFEKPVEMFADAGDVLIAISSSGRSENILLAVKAARAKTCKVITLSGFDPDNPLSGLGDINFHVPSHAYGPVEVLHHSICHCMLDTIIGSLK